MADANSAQSNIGKYQAGFKGSVLKEFSRPTPFKIVKVQSGADGMQLLGYGKAISHPTPTDPHGGRK